MPEREVPKFNPFDYYDGEAYELYMAKKPQKGVASSIYLFEHAVDDVLTRKISRGRTAKELFEPLLNQRRSEVVGWQPTITFEELTKLGEEKVYYQTAKALIIDELLGRHLDIQQEDLERYYIWDPEAREKDELQIAEEGGF